MRNLSQVRVSSLVGILIKCIKRKRKTQRHWWKVRMWGKKIVVAAGSFTPNSFNNPIIVIHLYSGIETNNWEQPCPDPEERRCATGRPAGQFDSLRPAAESLLCLYLFFKLVNLFVSPLHFKYSSCSAVMRARLGWDSVLSFDPFRTSGCLCSL